MFDDTDAYESFMGRWSRKLAPVFVAFAGVEDGEHVLDVGCGTGALAETIADTFPKARVVGIDPSADFIAKAKAKSGGRVHYEIGRAGRIEFGKGDFDRLLSQLVFNFLDDPAACLDDMTYATRPGGVIAAAVWDYGEGMKMLSAFWEEVTAMDPVAGARHEKNMPLCHAGELEALWRAGGLEEVEERPLTIEQRFASFDDYWRPFLGGVGPAGAFVASLGERARDGLRDRLQRRLLGAGDARGPFKLEARAWAVRGRTPRETRKKRS